MKNLVLLILLFSLNSYASEFAKNRGKEVVSPVTTDAKYAFYSGAVLTLGVLIFEDSIVDPVQTDVHEDKPLGKYSKYGDLAGQMVPNGIYIVSELLAGNDKYAQGMLKATLYSAGLTTLIKYTVREPRPNSPKERNSFPSGHSTTAFAFSGYIVATHGIYWGIPAFVLSGLVGFSRINDNRHYLHDVLGGATIGLAYGLGIGFLQKNEEGKNAVTVMPMYERDLKGLALYTEF